MHVVQNTFPRNESINQSHRSTRNALAKYEASNSIFSWGTFTWTKANPDPTEFICVFCILRFIPLAQS